MKILKQGLSTFDLKVIGITLMVIDHIHQMFVPMGAPSWLDWFGRPVATIFFFVSVVGFSHTHNKFQYMMRLYLGMVFMAVMTTALQDWVSYDQVVLMNNIFRDLFIGTMFMYAIDEVRKGFKTQHLMPVVIGVVVFLLPFICSVVMGMYMGTINPNLMVVRAMLALLPGILIAENSVMVLLIPLLYLFKDKKWIQAGLIALVAIGYFALGSTQWMMIFALLPIMLYNGQKGRSLKSFFYIFYPAHIAVLYLLAAVIYHH